MDQKKEQDKDPLRSKQELLNKYVQFSSLAIQIVVIVILGVFAGKWLDGKLSTEKPFATIFLTLLSIVFSLYYFVKKVRS